MVLLDEVRRRNRMRIGLMAAASFANYWVASLAIVAFVSTRASGSSQGDGDGTTDNSGAWLQVLVIGAVVAAICVAFYVARRVLGASRATVSALGSGVVPGDTDARLENLAEELAIAVGIKPVNVAVLNDPVPNALAVGTGRRMTIVVTTGALKQLSRDELEAVLAVQMCAIRRLDVALRTVVVSCASGAIAIHDDTEYVPPEGSGADQAAAALQGWATTALLWPIRVLAWPSWRVALRLRHMAFSDGDMGADDMAIAITRNPDALRSALTKLLDDPGVVQAVTAANAPLWVEPVPDAATDRGRSLAQHSMDASLEARIAHLGPRLRA
jgi:Zn-dependent protease with chaperone function